MESDEQKHYFQFLSLPISHVHQILNPFYNRQPNYRGSFTFLYTFESYIKFVILLNYMDFSISVHPHFQCIESIENHLCIYVWKYICKTYHCDDGFLNFIIPLKILCNMQGVCCNGLTKKEWIYSYIKHSSNILLLTISCIHSWLFFCQHPLHYNQSSNKLALRNLIEFTKLYYRYTKEFNY